MAISLTSIALPFTLGFFCSARCSTPTTAASPSKRSPADGQPPAEQCTSAEVQEKQQQVDKQTATPIEDGKEMPKPVQGQPVDFLPFAMFLGVSMCGTAFPVLARILAERNMFRIPLGLLLIACAAIDDIVAFTLLAFAAAIANGGGVGEVLVMVGKLAMFAAVLFLVVRPILEKFVVGPYRRAGTAEPRSTSASCSSGCCSRRSSRRRSACTS